MGSCSQAKQKWDTLSEWFRVHIWFSLIGHQAGAETRIKEAVSYSSSPGHFVMDIIVWLPGLVAIGNWSDFPQV